MAELSTADSDSRRNVYTEHMVDRSTSASKFSGGKFKNRNKSPMSKDENLMPINKPELSYSDSRAQTFDGSRRTSGVEQLTWQQEEEFARSKTNYTEREQNFKKNDRRKEPNNFKSSENRYKTEERNDRRREHNDVQSSDNRHVTDDRSYRRREPNSLRSSENRYDATNNRNDQSSTSNRSGKISRNDKSSKLMSSSKENKIGTNSGRLDVTNGMVDSLTDALFDCHRDPVGGNSGEMCRDDSSSALFKVDPSERSDLLFSKEHADSHVNDSEYKGRKKKNTDTSKGFGSRRQYNYGDRRSHREFCSEQDQNGEASDTAPIRDDPFPNDQTKRPVRIDRSNRNAATSANNSASGYSEGGQAFDFGRDSRRYEQRSDARQKNNSIQKKAAIPYSTATVEFYGERGSGQRGENSSKYSSTKQFKDGSDGHGEMSAVSNDRRKGCADDLRNGNFRPAGFDGFAAAPCARRGICVRPKSQFLDETQRGSLIEELRSNAYECMICCAVIRRDTAVWNCTGCFHLYHLFCIKKWAFSSAANVGNAETATGWRCPACQNICMQPPSQYMCFCGKMRDPPYIPSLIPHSCGDLCHKSRGKDCSHPCNILCHPGPCPPCQAFVSRTCLCGKTNRPSKCSDSAQFVCDIKCEKMRNCGKHSCVAGCHSGGCEPCVETIEQACFCGKITRSVICGSADSFTNSFSCESVCSRSLDCGNHNCITICHPGTCGTCQLLPSVVTHCPCGQTLLVNVKGAVKRTSCADEIKTCNLVCDKPLKCGTLDMPHRCKRKCHIGDCPPCDDSMSVDCQCGYISAQMPCKEALQMKVATATGDCKEAISSASLAGCFRCTRRCNKKMTCGRHKCAQLCCTRIDHTCQLICGHKLSCGIHKCEETCHRGNCSTCWQVSFDELHCTCGAQVIYPPVPCGTKPPDCNQPCSRQHVCEHKVLHNCHSEPNCPPCTVLSERMCMGGHELRRNIPCYLVDISCGLPCNKAMPCRQHKCILVCHKGPCLSDGDSCTQPCPLLRSECGHACLAPCHPGTPCPATLCKTEITLRCEGGHREEKRVCLQMGAGNTDYNKMAAQLVANKLWEAQSIDVAVLTKELSSKQNKKLPCNAECAQIDRNLRVALALEIKNPDLTSKLNNPTYSPFLKDYAKLNSVFVARIEETLSQLVISTQQQRVPKRSHSFKSMPSVQRRVIHELAEFYGCTTEAYDEEPNKNVVATAVKDKCWLPNITLTSLVQRELFPKAPMPIPIHSKEEDIRSAAQAVKQSTQVFVSTAAPPPSSKSGLQTLKKANKHKEPEIDYFDVTE